MRDIPKSSLVTRAGVLLLLMVLLTSDRIAAQSTVADEYAVFSAVLDKMYPEVMDSTFVVADSTHDPIFVGGGDFVRTRLATIPEVSVELLDAFSGANVERLHLDPEFFTASRPVVLPPSDSGVDVAFFSRVGFNADRSEAVVHTILNCGSRCAVGSAVYLKKESGRWIVHSTCGTMG